MSYIIVNKTHICISLLRMYNVRELYFNKCLLPAIRMLRP